MAHVVRLFQAKGWCACSTTAPSDPPTSMVSPLDTDILRSVGQLHRHISGNCHRRNRSLALRSKPHLLNATRSSSSNPPVTPFLYHQSQNVCRSCSTEPTTAS
ncbi:hypothetical protein BC834DRAFT_414685 [Gloeopeniophorella convolvens]|nr:hypothetical protein BC834DRAFT_414685 [Gloeopeniophorella convolvens]